MLPEGDKKLLLACIAGSVLAYNSKMAVRLASTFLRSGKKEEWIPVGTVKNLRIFPVKSCAAKEMFSVHCGPLGISLGELKDRHFLIVDGETGKFHSDTTVPRLMLLEADVADGKLTMKSPSGDEVVVDLQKVLAEKRILRATMNNQLQTDGLDCGDEVAHFLQKFNDDPAMRLIMYIPGLDNERSVTPLADRWISAVPKRDDVMAYTNKCTYMLTTEPSLNELNKRLEQPVTSLHFRATVVIDQCTPWDEDRWAELRIGDAQLECHSPCTRCTVTTVDPSTAIRDADNEPLKTLRKFRLAPEGRIRESHKDSPLFGVNACLVRPGYIHVGQTVWAKYKPAVY